MVAIVVRRLLWILPLLSTFSSGLGCMFFTTKREGDQLRQELAGMKARLNAAEKGTVGGPGGLDKTHRDLVELKDLLPKAKELLQRSSARVGAKLDQLDSLVSKLQGRLESLETDAGSGTKTIQALKVQVAQVVELQERIRAEVTKLMVEVRRPVPEPKTANELFARATIARLAGRYPEARQDYEALIQKFPTDPRVEACNFFMAQTYFDAFDFKASVVAIARQLKGFPEGKLATAARLLSARSHAELKKCGIAIRILTRLLQTAPSTEESTHAQTLLNHLRRVQRVTRYCIPGG
jgi:TolA-binding protein